MAKKDYFLLVDTETTKTDKVVDFGAVLTDRKGNIHKELGALVADLYNDRENNPLFYNEFSDQLWSKSRLDERYANYNDMLQNGNRILASVNGINKWLAQALAHYNPIITAYNLAFDKRKSYNTGIDLEMFNNSFCLMKASQDKWQKSKQYRQFVLDNHLFNNRTKLGNMSFTYKAEAMAKFVLGNPELDNEPHTALEDAKFYELPILIKLVNTTKRDRWMNPEGFGWQELQVKDWYKPK
jgi:hypothetical protein